MSSAIHDNLDEQSPLLPDNQASLPALQPQPTNTSSTLAPSRPPTPPAPTSTPSPQPKPATSSSPPAPPLITASPTPVPKPDLSPDPWGPPAGLPLRSASDENLVIFRRAVGINSSLPSPSSPSTLEAGGGLLPRPRRHRQHPAHTGIYAAVVHAAHRKAAAYAALNTLLWAAYLLQVVVGAALAALGPGAREHPGLITGLGVLNTVVAGGLALVKGQGLPERLRRDEMEFARLRDWVEETEALLAVGVVGRDRKEVGVLVEGAFRRYNAARRSEEDNRPESYVSQTVEEGGVRGERRISGVGSEGGR